MVRNSYHSMLFPAWVASMTMGALVGMTVGIPGRGKLEDVVGTSKLLVFLRASTGSTIILAVLFRTDLI